MALIRTSGKSSVLPDGVNALTTIYQNNSAISGSHNFTLSKKSLVIVAGGSNAGTCTFNIDDGTYTYSTPSANTQGSCAFVLDAGEHTVACSHTNHPSGTYWSSGIVAYTEIE